MRILDPLFCMAQFVQQYNVPTNFPPVQYSFRFIGPDAVLKYRRFYMKFRRKIDIDHAMRRKGTITVKGCVTAGHAYDVNSLLSITYKFQNFLSGFRMLFRPRDCLLNECLGLLGAENGRVPEIRTFEIIREVAPNLDFRWKY
jgi:hypothetical protein